MGSKHLTNRLGERRRRGFEQAGSLLRGRIRKVGEERGFAVSQVLTRWDEIAGEQLAGMARPVKVTYAARGMGATLVLLCSGARAPLVEMQKERLREKVNACYGYNAVSRIQITQTAATGFAEAQAAFHTARLAGGGEVAAAAAAGREAARLAAGVSDAGLRAILEEMGRGVLARQRRNGASTRE